MKNWSRLSFFIVACLWGMSFAFQKTLLVYLDPLALVFWDFTAAWLVIVIIAVSERTNVFYRLREGLLLGLLLAGQEIFQMIGLHVSTSAHTVFISNLGMLIIPYSGWLLFRHRVSLKNNIAIVVAIIGMYLLVGGVHGFGLGEGILLVSAIAMSLYFLYSQRFEGEKGRHMTALLVQQFTVVAALSGVLVLATGKGFSVPSVITASLIWQVLAFTVVPFALIQWASRWADEMTAAIYDGVVEPLVGGITSWVFFAEPVTRTALGGAFLMILAFSFASIFSNRHFLKDHLHTLRIFSKN